jgi:hypothetical protein
MDFLKKYTIKGVIYTLIGVINQDGWYYVFEDQEKKQLIINVDDKIEIE